MVSNAPSNRTSTAASPHGGESAAGARPVGANPWSKAAVAGFCAGMLGCTIVGGLAGLILGVVGIIKTGGGQRRGLGLAIAAIPISLVTASIGGLALFAYLALSNMSGVAVQASQAMGKASVAESAGALRRMATDTFNEAVPLDQLEAWLTAQRSTHGRLVSTSLARSEPSGQTESGGIFLSYDGKFVNGDASVRFFFDATSVVSEPKLANIEIDGTAVRPLDEE